MRRVLRGATARTFVVQPRPPKRRLLELTLVRHGQSEGNLAYRRAGQGDDSLYDGAFMDRHSSLWRLTDRGRREARAAGECAGGGAPGTSTQRWRPPGTIYSRRVE